MPGNNSTFQAFSYSRVIMRAKPDRRRLFSVTLGLLIRCLWPDVSDFGIYLPEGVLRGRLAGSDAAEGGRDCVTEP